MREATTLFLAANPASTERLMLDEEVRDVQERIQRRSCTIDLNLESHWAVRPADLQRLLNEVRPDVVHFSGHGGAPGLMFHNGKRRSKMVSGETLGELFRLFRAHVRIVVLNACYSAAQARHISKEIDWVVGMTRAVSDKAAVEFAGGFYQALAYGKDVRNAVEQGRIAMRLDGLDEQETPCLLARRGVASALVLGTLVNGHARRSTSRGRDVIAGLPSTACTAESQRRYVIRLEASLSEMNPALLDELTRLLRECTGDMTLTIEKMEEGSIILTIVTTEAGGNRLVEVHESGHLRRLAGLRVTSVQARAGADLIVEAKTAVRTVGAVAVAAGGATAIAVAASDSVRAQPPTVEHPQLPQDAPLNAAEFEALIHPHLSMLKVRARQLCRGEMDPDDLFQDTLFRALKHQHQLRDLTRIRPWLLSVMQSTFVDGIRRQARSPSVSLHASPEVYAEEPTEPLPWENISDEDVRAALEALPDDTRRTYRMSVMEGRSYAEIAAALNVPRATVETRIRRARTQLRVLLASRLK
jgi:RNA polymerase sigma factor (sigma-70 family)